MGALVNRSPVERSDLGHPWCIIARGALDMSTAAWVGAHPGFTDVVTDNGPGYFTVHLAADGDPATMFARVTGVHYNHKAGWAFPLGGVGNRDLSVSCRSAAGTPSNPAGWNPGALLGELLAEDGIVIIEVLETAV